AAAGGTVSTATGASGATDAPTLDFPFVSNATVPRIRSVRRRRRYSSAPLPMRGQSMRTIAFAIFAVLAIAPSLVEARIVSVTWDPARSQSPTVFPGQSPTFGGLSFGTVGQYEKLRGTARGELDPNDRRNRVITDIQLAPRNANGMVEYSMDVFILKPI